MGSYETFRQRQNALKMIESSRFRRVVRDGSPLTPSMDYLVQSKTETGYAFRLRCVQQIGFSNYELYLQSPKWAAIRLRTLIEQDRRCYICHGAATAIHHERYTWANLNGTDHIGLKAICQECHDAIELTKDGIPRGSLTLVFYAALKRMRQFGTDCPKDVPAKPTVTPNLGKHFKRCPVCRRNWTKRGRNYCRPCRDRLGLLSWTHQIETKG